MVSCWAGWIWCLIYFHLHSLSWYNILSLSWGQKGFFFLMIHIFASAPLPPLSFSFSPPSSLFLSSLLVLCRPAAETGCVTSLKAGAVPWLEQEGEKNGEKIRRWVRPHVSFAFSNVPLSSDHVCVSMCVCVCASFVASLLPLRSSRATNFMQRRESGSSKEPVLPWKHKRKSGTRQVVPSPLCTAAVTSIGVN